MYWEAQYDENKFETLNMFIPVFFHKTLSCNAASAIILISYV